MRRIEKLSIDEGADDEAYMDRAASGIVEILMQRPLGAGKIALLIGKGNNGGDGYAVAALLLAKGLEPVAISLEESSPLCQKKSKAFSGKRASPDDVDFSSFDLIIDALLGTGFKGDLEPSLKALIEKANSSGLPIYAIDIPSGLNGDTGETSCAIKATETVTLGAVKSGFFKEKGFDHIGKLSLVDFGLNPRYLVQANPEAYLIDEDYVMGLLPKIERTRHKYQAGYVLALAGSPGMPGAALLACLAAMRAGAGIVRLFHPAHMEEEFAGAPLELIRSHNLEEVFTEAKRAKSLLIGPGLGRSEESKKRFLSLFQKVALPTVCDADGLYFLSELTWKAEVPLILTPHKQEMMRLLHAQSLTDEELFSSAAQYAEEKGCTLVLKGAPTRIFHPGKKPLILVRGDPGMATAGTGDVLTGVIAGLLAQGMNSYEAAILGVHLHGLAGEYAAEALSSRSLIASDLIDFLPEIFVDEE